MKILIISENQINKYNWGHQLFRNEIARQHDVLFFGPGYTTSSLKKFLIKNKTDFDDIDFVFTYGLKYTKKIEDIWTIPDNVTKVHYVIDFFVKKDGFKGREQSQYDFLNKYKPDIIFSVYHNSIRPIKKNTGNEKVFVLPFSVCTQTYKKIHLLKENKIMTCFSTRPDAYPNRGKAIQYLNDNNFKIVQRQKRYDYIKAINKCKISLGVCDIFKSLNMRVTEILACGGLFLTDKPNYIEELGLIENKHYVTYKSFKDMAYKIKYYFLHDKERTRIENEGMRFVRENHSCEKRVKQMIKIINKCNR